MPREITITVSDAWDAATEFDGTPEQQIARLEKTAINNAFQRVVFNGLQRVHDADPEKAQAIKDKLITEVVAETVKIDVADAAAADAAAAEAAAQKEKEAQAVRDAEAAQIEAAIKLREENERNAKDDPNEPDVPDEKVDPAEPVVVEPVDPKADEK